MSTESILETTVSATGIDFCRGSISDLPRHLSEIRERGYTVVPDVLCPDELHALRTAIEEVYKREDSIAESRGWKNSAWRIAYLLPQKHSIFRNLPLNPRLLPLIRAVLGNNCVIINMNGMAMLPGGEGQRLHRDGESVPGHPMFVNALHALDDFTIANGCTRMVPKSQERPGYREVEGDRRLVRPGEADPMEADAIHVEVPAGSVIVYDGGMWHGGSANKTDQMRRGLHLFYGRPWIRPTYDFARSISPEVAEAMTPEQRAIFGLHLRQAWYDWQTDTRRMD